MNKISGIKIRNNKIYVMEIKNEDEYTWKRIWDYSRLNDIIKYFTDKACYLEKKGLLKEEKEEIKEKRGEIKEGGVNLGKEKNSFIKEGCASDSDVGSRVSGSASEIQGGCADE